MTITKNGWELEAKIWNLVSSFQKHCYYQQIIFMIGISELKNGSPIRMYWMILLVSYKKHMSRSPCSCAPREKIFVLKDCLCHELTTFQILASNSQPFFSYSHYTILKILLLLVSHKKHVSRYHCSYAPRENFFVLKDSFWHELTTFQILTSNSQP